MILSTYFISISILAHWDLKFTYNYFKISLSIFNKEEKMFSVYSLSMYRNKYIFIHTIDNFWAWAKINHATSSQVTYIHPQQFLKLKLLYAYLYCILFVCVRAWDVDIENFNHDIHSILMESLPSAFLYFCFFFFLKIYGHIYLRLGLSIPWMLHYLR